MEHDFWNERWQSNRIAFHEPRPNPLLVSHFATLDVPANGRVFVPLCGKTLDIGWLLRQGHNVAGAELSQLAVAQLFDELGIDPEITDIGGLKRYSGADNDTTIDIFTGDIFELAKEMLGPVDAVYDRAAFVALPRKMRGGYAGHMADITDHVRQLMITFEYDQTLMEGPPFSISSDEVARCYGEAYEIVSLEVAEVDGGLKGTPASETVWRLSPR